ncbi:unnamed protein product [Schistocephalus solidus]|uniref:SHSP domain-containing protein n=1 Tax=Schistocephalus solidus TaxID=70667 RepID=A0A183T360_SCHSO|nr:unnamed protein product [Schistocephalus solidus]
MFKPEDVEVFTRDNCLVVHGKKEEECDMVNSAGPDKASKENVHATLRSEGVLVVEVSVKEPDYSVIKFDDDRKFCVVA